MCRRKCASTIPRQDPFSAPSPDPAVAGRRHRALREGGGSLNTVVTDGRGGTNGGPEWGEPAVRFVNRLRTKTSVYVRYYIVGKTGKNEQLQSRVK